MSRLYEAHLEGNYTGSNNYNQNLISFDDDYNPHSNVFTEGVVNLKICDVSVTPDFLYTDKDTGQQTSGLMFKITFAIMSGPDTSRVFTIHYNVGHPKWGHISKKQYGLLGTVIYGSFEALKSRGGNPVDLLEKTFSALLRNDKKEGYVRLSKYGVFDPSLSAPQQNNNFVQNQPAAQYNNHFAPNQVAPQQSNNQQVSSYNIEDQIPY